MSLQGRSIAVLAYPGYQELEFWYPVLRGREESATVWVVAADAQGSESYLGYPVIPDADAGDLDPATVDALVAPGVVDGPPQASEPQRQLIRAVQAAGGRLYAIGTGAALMRDALGAAAGAADYHCEAGPDDLPALLRTLRHDLGG
jgi:protease I